MITSRRKRGVSIAEAAASLVVLLPLMVAVLYVVLESSYAYLIKYCMSEAARQAARDLAIEYGQDNSIAGDRSKENTEVFDKIRIMNMVNDSGQFDDPVFDTAADPPTVVVTCRYVSNTYGLPRFPNPDPLHLGGSFSINATATYRLE